MNLIENFTASFKYLFTNGSVFCVMGILFILSNIANFNNTINLLKSGNLILFNSGIDLSNGIFLIISFISAIFIIGYCLSIIKTTLDGLDKLPKLNFKSMFIGGIKSIVVLIVYIIIAAIILAIIGYCTGIFDLIAQINVQLVSNVNSTAIPVNVAQRLIVFGIFLIIISAMMFVLYNFSLARLAKYDSMSKALNFKEVFADIFNIGLGKTITWFLLMIIIVFIMEVIILGLLQLTVIEFNYSGILIFILSSFFLTNFVNLFIARSVGLLYKNSFK